MILITSVLLTIAVLGLIVLKRKKHLRCSISQDAASPVLNQSREFLDSLIENLPNMVFVKDASELRFIRFNKAGEDLLGYSKSDLMGKNDYDFFPKDQADFFISKDRAVLAGHEIVDIPQEQITTKYRGVRTLHTKKIPLLDKDGNPQYLLGISDDITERVKAEEERLRLSREQAALEEREKASKLTEFLAEASTIMASSLDYQSTLGKVSKLIVKEFSEGCLIVLNQSEGKPRDKSFMHNELLQKIAYEQLSKGITLEEFLELDNNKINAQAGIINGGDIYETASKSETKDTLASLEKFKTTVFLLIPMMSREQIHGTIVFMRSGVNSSYSSQDILIALELGRRLSVAVENSKLYETAQEAVMMRDEFLSIASHELKTPMTVLKLQLQLLQRTSKQNKDAFDFDKLGKVMESSTLQIDRLVKLVDELLDVSRIQAGKFDLNPEDINLGLLIKDIIDRTTQGIQERNFEIKLSSDQEILGFWDKVRIEQIMTNLISNAIKYAPGSDIEVILKVMNGRVSLSVKDHGPGIDKEIQSKVFQKFERLKASKNISGLGLGLYIVHEIVKAHGGQVSLESEVGHGAKFTIELPLRTSLEALGKDDNSSNLSSVSS